MNAETYFNQIQLGRPDSEQLTFEEYSKTSSTFPYIQDLHGDPVIILGPIEVIPITTLKRLRFVKVNFYVFSHDMVSVQYVTSIHGYQGDHTIRLLEDTAPLRAVSDSINLKAIDQFYLSINNLMGVTDAHLEVQC